MTSLSFNYDILSEYRYAFLYCLVVLSDDKKTAFQIYIICTFGLSNPLKI